LKANKVGATYKNWLFTIGKNQQLAVGGLLPVVEGFGKQIPY